MLHLALTLTLSRPSYDQQRRFIVFLVQDPNPNHALALALTSFSTCARCFMVFLVRRSVVGLVKESRWVSTPITRGKPCTWLRGG